MRRIAAVLGAALLAVSPARGQDQGLRIEVEAGWEGSFVEDAWAPLRVVVSLPPGSPPLRGRLVCEPVPGERVPGTEARFALAPTAAETASAVVRFAVPARGDLSFTVRAEDEKGTELARAAPHDLPHRVDSRDHLVLLAGRRSGLAALAQAQASLPAAPSLRGVAMSLANRPPAIHVARVEAEEIPDRPWILSAASAVFLEDGDGMVELARDEARLAALEAYARGGATLVIVGGRGAAFWAGSGLERLLPVSASGALSSLTPRDLAALGAPGGGDARASRAELKDGIGARDLLHDGTGPGEPVLAAERPLGRGRVVFLAFDPDEIQVRGAPAVATLLARLVLESRGKPPAPSPERLVELTARDLVDRPSLTVAGLMGIAASAAAALIVLGPVAARRRSVPSRVLVAPGLAAALAALVVAVAAATRGPLEVDAIAYGFAESGSDEALVVEDLGAFAGPATSVDVELLGGATVLPLEAPKLDLLAFRERRRGLRVERGERAVVEALALPPKGFAWFRAGAFSRLRASLKARREGDELALEASLGPIPAGIALRVDPVAHAAWSSPTPALMPGSVESVRLEAPRPWESFRESEGAPLWERTVEDRSRAQLIRALGAIGEEIQVAGAPGRAGHFPRTWVALPVPIEPLARVVEAGRPIERRASLSVLLVAAEEAE